MKRATEFKDTDQVDMYKKKSGVQDKLMSPHYLIL